MSVRTEAWLTLMGVALIGLGCAGPLRSRLGDARSANEVPPRRMPPTTLPPAATAPPPLAQASAQTPAEGGPLLEPAKPTPATLPDNPAERPRALYRMAAERYAAIDSYIARVRRREVAGGKAKPEEVLLFKYRKEPLSVYFKWVGPEGHGREVVYVRGQHGDKIHTKLAAGDMPLAPAGHRVAVAPDSIFARSASRHSITEAGIGNIVEHYGKLLDAIDRGDPKAGSVKYLGPVKRPEFEAPLEVIERTIPPGADPDLPRGGRRQCMFDLTARLPVVVITLDPAGNEVEYYCYDRLEIPVKLDNDDFDPDKLWPVK